MLRGLELITADEYLELGRLLGLDLSLPTADAAGRVLGWMSKVVGTTGTKTTQVERAVLEWVAKHWAIDFEAEILTDDLERLIRRRIATEATEFLAPAWRVACALMVADASVVADRKFEMLERAAGRVVPSQSVLEEHSKEWVTLAASWARSDPRPDLKTDLEFLKQHPGLGRQALRLGLVIALADGRLSPEERRLVQDFAPLMGMTELEARDLTEDLNTLFLANRELLNKSGKFGPIKLGLEAAQRTLAESRTVEGLAEEARENVVHEENQAPEAQDASSSGWSRLLGALSGIVHFFSAKIDEESPANLVRIVYLTIEKQRAEIVQLGE